MVISNKNEWLDNQRVKNYQTIFDYKNTIL